MSVWRWVKGRLNVRSYYPWKIIWGGDVDSGQTVSQDTAFSVSAWWAAVRLITETVATLPLGIYQKEGDERKALPDHPLYALLHDSPNADQTPVEFWEGRVGPVCTEGNSFCEKRYIGSRLVALEPFAGDVTPYRDPETRKLVYKLNDRGKEETLPPDKVFHIKGFGFDGDEGFSPLQYGARALGGAIAAHRAAARTFSRGLRAPGFWVPPMDMDKDQRADFIKNYVRPLEGLEAQTPVMPPGFDWKNMGVNSKDAELVAMLGISVEDVCRYMGVPPVLVGHNAAGQTMWGTGVEQIILGWLVLGLRAYLKRIEASVNYRLLTREDRLKGIYFEFNFEGLLRADSEARARLMASLVQNGLLNRNEARKLDNRPAYDGGELFTVQSNLIPVERLGETQAAGGQAEQVRNAIVAWLSDYRDPERKAA